VGFTTNRRKLLPLRKGAGGAFISSTQVETIDVDWRRKTLKGKIIERIEGGRGHYYLGGRNTRHCVVLYLMECPVEQGSSLWAEKKERRFLRRGRVGSAWMEHTPKGKTIFTVMNRKVTLSRSLREERRPLEEKGILLTSLGTSFFLVLRKKKGLLLKKEQEGLDLEER